MEIDDKTFEILLDHVVKIQKLLVDSIKKQIELEEQVRLLLKEKENGHK